jgi:hypothetical protein
MLCQKLTFISQCLSRPICPLQRTAAAHVRIVITASEFTQTTTSCIWEVEICSKATRRRHLVLVISSAQVDRLYRWSVVISQRCCCCTNWHVFPLFKAQIYEKQWPHMQNTWGGSGTKSPRQARLVNFVAAGCTCVCVSARSVFLIFGTYYVRIVGLFVCQLLPFPSCKFYVPHGTWNNGFLLSFWRDFLRKLGCCCKHAASDLWFFGRTNLFSLNPLWCMALHLRLLVLT